MPAVPVFADILCAIDGKPGGFAAVEHAAALAGPQGHLTLLVVTSYRSEGEFRSPAMGPGQVTKMLDHATQIAQEAGVPCTSEVDPAGPPSQVILDWSARYDMLALGAPASSRLGRMFIEGVGDAALDVLTCPLLVARSAPAARDFADRILVASDCLDGSEELVELAGQLAHAAGAHVTLLHATGHEPHIKHRPHEDQERRLQAQKRKLELTLDGRSEVRIEPGSAHDVIVNTAQGVEASLVIMGSRALQGLRAIGSVSRRVAHEAACSVLLVPPANLKP